MAGFSATRSMMAGVGFVRRDVGVVVLWGLVCFALSLVVFALRLAIPLHLQGSVSGHPNLRANLIILITLFIKLPCDAMLWLAAFRAFVRPDQRAFAYLRFGIPEARLMGYLAQADAIWFVVLFLDVFGATSIIVSNRWGANLYVFEWLESLPLLATFVAGGLLLVRFSLTPSLLLDRNPQPLRESWKLTREIYWPLVGALIAVLVATWIVLLPILAVELAKIGLTSLTGAGLKAWAAAAQQSMLQMHAHPLQALLSPVRLGEFFVAGMTKAVSLAVTAGIIGSAYAGRRPAS